MEVYPEDQHVGSDDHFYLQRWRRTIYIIDILLGVCSTWALVEVIHHGSIFANFRGYVEERGGFFGDLVECPYCMSHWFAFGVAGWIVAVHTFAPDSLLLRLPLLWLSITRLSNLANDVLYPLCRTVRDEYVIGDDDGEEEV